MMQSSKLPTAWRRAKEKEKEKEKEKATAKAKEGQRAQGQDNRKPGLRPPAVTTPPLRWMCLCNPLLGVLNVLERAARRRRSATTSRMMPMVTPAAVAPWTSCHRLLKSRGLEENAAGRRSHRLPPLRQPCRECLFGDEDDGDFSIRCPAYMCQLVLLSVQLSAVVPLEMTTKPSLFVSTSTSAGIAPLR